jgi:hypothetical protein
MDTPCHVHANSNAPFQEPQGCGSVPWPHPGTCRPQRQRQDDLPRCGRPPERPHPPTWRRERSGLFWQRELREARLAGRRNSQAFQLAVEAPIPAEVRERMADDKKQYAVVRYELEIGMDQASNQLGLNHETLWLRTAEPERDAPQRALFPAAPDEAPNLLSQSRKGSRVALKKVPSGNDNYYPEGSASYTPSFKLGRAKAALANIPADEKSFPVSSWFRSLLESGVQKVVLNSQTIRQPSPPGLGFRFQTDGSNLPWVIAVLRRDEDRFTAWLEHVRTALEDVTLTRWRGKRTGTGTWSSATRMAPKCLLGWFRTGRFGSWR